MNAQEVNAGYRIFPWKLPIHRSERSGVPQISLVAFAVVLTFGRSGVGARADATSVTPSSTPSPEATSQESLPTDLSEEVDSSAAKEVEAEEVPGTSKDEQVPREEESASKKLRVIGATARLREKQSGIMFNARIDTGARTCSLHVDQILIEDESERMLDNIGKPIRFSLINGDKDADWCQAIIEKVVRVKTTGGFDRRYKVRLTLQWKDVEKRVLVTLNNRDEMEFPLLIGRNFLRGDFVVDVNVDNPEKPQH